MNDCYSEEYAKDKKELVKFLGRKKRSGFRSARLCGWKSKGVCIVLFDNDYSLYTAKQWGG